MSLSKTTEQHAVLFGDEMSKVYAHFAQQHYHKDGPLLMITNIVADFVNSCEKKDMSLKVLDLASGPGEPAASIAKRIPSATVYATDISETMIESAIKNTQSIPNIKSQLADMQNLPFESESFDVVTCCYGYMFPPDKKKALSESYRVLKPGGILVATTWNNQPTIELMIGLFQKLTGNHEIKLSFNPLALAEPGLFEHMIIDAGFDNETLKMSTSKYPFVFPNDPNFHAAMTIATDFDKHLQNVDVETIKATFAELAPAYLETTDDGDLVSIENIFKCIVIGKSK